MHTEDTSSRRSRPSAAADRTERLAAELRANLKRRKEQARARKGLRDEGISDTDEPHPDGGRTPDAPGGS